VFEFTLARFYKAFVGAKLELEGPDCGIFGIGHRMQCLNRCTRWRDLSAVGEETVTEKLRCQAAKIAGS
jgi:hypothetical protein